MFYLLAFWPPDRSVVRAGSKEIRQNLCPQKFPHTELCCEPLEDSAFFFGSAGRRSKAVTVEGDAGSPFQGCFMPL